MVKSNLFCGIRVPLFREQHSAWFTREEVLVLHCGEHGDCVLVHVNLLDRYKSRHREPQQLNLPLFPVGWRGRDGETCVEQIGLQLHRHELRLIGNRVCTNRKTVNGSRGCTNLVQLDIFEKHLSSNRNQTAVSGSCDTIERRSKGMQHAQTDEGSRVRGAADTNLKCVAVQHRHTGHHRTVEISFDLLQPLTSPDVGIAGHNTT